MTIRLLSRDSVEYMSEQVQRLEDQSRRGKILYGIHCCCSGSLDERQCRRYRCLLSDNISAINMAI